MKVPVYKYRTFIVRSPSGKTEMIPTYTTTDRQHYFYKSGSDTMFEIECPEDDTFILMLGGHYRNYKVISSVYPHTNHCELANLD